MSAKRKGHVLILVQNLPLPFDRRVWMESLALTEAGYKVSVISPRPEDDPRGHLVLDGVHLYRYEPPAPTSGKLSFFREFAYCYLQTRKLVDQIWREDEFDVIQSCNPPDTFWRIARRYRRHGVKFVFDHHDLCPELYESKYGRRDLLYRVLCWLERKQFATADAVIATNESYRRVAIERGGKNPRQVTVVRSGPSLKRFHRSAPDERLRRGRRHLVVYLGVMGVQDGVDLALRAVRHMLDTGYRDASFALIGKGDAFDRMVKLATDLELGDFVHFAGRIPDDDLCRYLSTADLGLVPDPKNPLNDVSTMNKVVEYMAMELPMVSFELRETRFSAGGAAVYVPNDDPAGMAAEVVALLGDPQRRRVMAKQGRERFERELAWEYSRTELVDLYDALLRGEDVLRLRPAGNTLLVAEAK
jgi:glycosyltransferase involved in cell wall biosynthesis